MPREHEGSKKAKGSLNQYHRLRQDSLESFESRNDVEQLFVNRTLSKPMILTIQVSQEFIDVLIGPLHGG